MEPEVVVQHLKEMGFTEHELACWWAGYNPVSLKDPRVQELIAEAVRFRQARASVKAAARPQPVVLRPGTAPAPGRGVQQDIRNLEKQLQTAKGSNATRIAALLQQKHREANGW